MDLQADINWIRAELKEVKDPDLIAVFKGMLKYRNKKVSKESAFDEAFNRALEDKKMGRTRPHEDVRKKYEKWL